MFRDWPTAKRHVKYCRKGPNARNLDRTLDCAYCPPGSGEFKDFKELAEHVLLWHVHSWAPSATQEDVNILLRQQLDAESKQLSNGGNMALPAPEASANGNNNPFLKVGHFNDKKKGTLKLLGGRMPTGESTKYNDILLDVKLDGKSYTWGLKADQRNYAALFKRFGSDEKKWIGSVQVVIAKDKYINVAGT